MMQLVSSNGTVLLEREKPSTKRANNSTLHVRRMSQGIKKTVRPVLMSKEEFFTKVIKAATKREQSDACISFAEREQARQNVKTNDDANV